MRRGWAHRETHAQLWGVGRVSSCCTGSVDAQARRGACDAAATVRGRRSVRGCGVVEWWSGRKPRRRAAAVLMRQARARRRRDALPRAAPPPLPPPDSTLRPRAAHQPARRAAPHAAPPAGVLSALVWLATALRRCMAAYRSQPRPDAHAWLCPWGDHAQGHGMACRTRRDGHTLTRASSRSRGLLAPTAPFRTLAASLLS
jgi:hypothetical protein